MAAPKKLPKEFQAKCTLCTWEGRLKAKDLADGEIVTCPDCGGHVTIETPWPPSDGGEIAVQAQVSTTTEAPRYYTPEMWKGVKQVFKCAKCGAFLEDRDDMIEHVLIHVPKAQQETVFNQLLKEK